MSKKVELPIWFVTERAIGPVPSEACGSYAFTEANDVLKFMVNRSPARWDVVHATTRERVLLTDLIAV